MFKEKLLLIYHALTPVHFGTGVSLSYVDNPIQREIHTDYPMLAGSGIKGVIRELASREWKDKDKVKTIFGPEAGENSSAYASCIAFTDAKILLFPVRSVRGVFAWITSPYVLKRFKSELESLGSSIDVNIPDVEDSKVLICSSSTLKIDDNKVVFEEFVFEVDNEKRADNVANRLKNYLPSQLKDELEKRLAIVSDNVFRDFVKYAVEIRTRIRINQTTGTVEEGALFTIELAPTEAVFYGFVFIADPYNENPSNENKDLSNSSDVKKKVCKLLKDHSIIQFGGDETLGMGLMRVSVFDCQPQDQTLGQTQSGGSNT